MMVFLSALVLMGSYGYAQTEKNNENSGSESSAHGSTVSDLAQNTTATGKAKGSLISSAARAKALTVANANARFLRGDAKPTKANTNTNSASANANVKASVNANANASTNANVNSALTVSSGATLHGKPSTLPPVTAPTTGQPASTPVGAPVGVPVAVQAITHAAAGLSHH